MVGLVAGIVVALVSPAAAAAIGLLGTLFVGALKAVAPLLVLVLVMASIANHKQGQKTNIRPILHYRHQPAGWHIVEVIKGLLMSVVANPFHALINANYIGILAWAVGLGLALRHASETTKSLINDMSHAVTMVVRAVIRCAPLGIFGLVASTLAETGFSALWGYAQLLCVLIGCMLLVALVLNPLIVYWKIRRNPYPLVFTCLRESGVTAFFTRSSAANIPVNMELSRKLNLNEDTYSVSIPLGATINMAGAAITITVLTLAAVHTLGIPVDVPTALLLSVVAAICACGASGVAGGSLLLIPLACNMFGIPNEIAMQVVAVGFIIGVLQDSAETALNSSTDVLFTAAACQAEDQRLANEDPLKLQAAAADNVETVHQQKTTFNQRSPDRAKPDVVGDQQAVEHHITQRVVKPRHRD
ncbi:hypothetical protein HA402_007380 [Bradysia odoriphaga]|nr:hypothetical protein HA402_007380 [Bradysia odoriphaga]